MQIQVYQGEREIAAHNKRLVVFELDGIAPAPRGVPRVEITFQIDTDGNVNVSARNLGTGRQRRVVIRGGLALSKEQVQRALADAADHAAADRMQHHAEHPPETYL
jgi:molecular chaperone DnaK